MIKAIDIGYTFTKDESKNKFKSAYTTIDSVVTGAHKLKVDNKTFYVGTGKETIDLDKCETEINRLCLLTDLALSQDDEFFIVTGLPINQYKEQKDKLKNFFLLQNNKEVSINDKIEKIIRINDILVYPQGVGALYSQNIQGDIIIVDIGGRTLDVALIEMVDGKYQLQKSNTWYEGMLVLYSKVIEVINKKFELSLEPRYAEKFLLNGLELFGEKQDLTFTVPVVQEHFEKIFRELMLNYPSKTTPIYLCGGGAHLLYNAFQKRFPNVQLMQEGQFANVMGFYQIAQKEFKVKDAIRRNVSTWQLPKNH